MVDNISFSEQVHEDIKSSGLAELPKEMRLELYKMMVLIRRFEEKSSQSFMQAKIKGFCHLCIGQEAIAVGVCAAIGPEDVVVTAYRDHGIALARGVSPKACMAELYGKSTGTSKGMGGSMHLFDKRKKFFGGHAIVAAQCPIAAGVAFAQRYLKENTVTVCLLGDGAVNQGVFHETLNLVSLWKLPVVYIIENNQYAMGTEIHRSTAGLPLVKKSVAYDMAGMVIDGMNVEEVRKKVLEAANLARNENCPVLIEARTYRFRGHSMSDPDTYRTKEEIAEAKKRDPIALYSQLLLDLGILTRDLIAQIDKEIKKVIQEAVQYAESSPEPDLELARNICFADEDSIEPPQRPLYGLIVD
ncbi:pyruvate dehydrogenase (acetyl-transferring) E1 component subunit alpha [Candidatus Methylacidiphilum fumarolicum]|uniref:Pyruvate dehydrogenase E1 component subunit alpha n=2 Tax=Candidatus Methylacidiphilum fumarolicum TaxID=591154 RepID=I0JWN2_METFB|nr:pyruvate dehydrogenase (acetyl-transferring) E1 component subunit alpha [Candidatus Methylacidiphilum fumarolicum]MBW6414340.1 pyruvate dehydrogenase (acetyl-transferring) E1 component subunit alpha [Candidatus Methylacidiphilum fumarolicum]TFE73021.1 pyruvate dehydrogenase (acetyl-transferring) E1 component subunit alpha [Candidatus Methylacidiphilum fumarolicum]TFE75115.1 pyruvate dehydrogenase (acetyl-transferring) E1 component subunit alpha [Candidatus Methylacidiphilum fumarolicum]CAI90